ncbi:MAG: ribonuclease Y [Defluviitaleaceae bacterium]|nr:ribonuclease Y [Defluviitaleaceae bacterium]
MTTSVVIIIAAAVAVVFCVIGFVAGVVYRKKIAESKTGVAEEKAKTLLEEARRNAEARAKEMLLEAKEESIKTKSEAEKDAKERRNELQRLEKRLVQKEEQLDKKLEKTAEKEDQLREKNDQLDEKQAELNSHLARQNQELERIAGMTAEEAKAALLAAIEQEAKFESAKLIRDIEQKAKVEADKKARDVLASAVQRCAVDHVAETTVSVVNLPSDEMKGRIIGREGRNIRALESLTGIDLIIDDTPEAVILSGFDPMRREIARLSLEKLVVDGRIHPTRIEEVVEKSRKEVEIQIKEEGEAATFETGVHGIHPELTRLLGKMKFRTSYGQNVLKHSIEVAYLCGLLAGELGADVALAKRAGLLHDIGKAIDHDVEGSHVSIGAGLCKKYKESDLIINAVEAHHGDVEPTNIISVITQIADSISGSRPGARRETLEAYMKRLQALEAIADEFDGVEKSFAIQAGRELRIVIIPDIVDDASLILLARDIAKRIESELEYPGQIKVSLIRETRAIEYAK